MLRVSRKLTPQEESESVQSTSKIPCGVKRSRKSGRFRRKRPRKVPKRYRDDSANATRQGSAATTKTESKTSPDDCSMNQGAVLAAGEVETPESGDGGVSRSPEEICVSPHKTVAMPRRKRIKTNALQMKAGGHCTDVASAKPVCGRLFKAGTRGAAAWDACGGVIMEYLGAGEVLRLSPDNIDIWDSVAAWTLVACGLTKVHEAARVRALARDYPQARGALNEWMSKGFRGALTSLSDADCEGAVKALRRTAYQARREKIFVAKDPKWLKRHKDLRKTYFPILCNWLVELHFELFGDHARRFQCDSPLTPIQRAMKYLFLYLSRSKEAVFSNRLQLVGVSCYQISIEFTLGRSETEKLKLDAKRYAYYTDDAYQPEEVKEMTEKIRDVVKARHQELNSLPGGVRSHLALGHSEPFMVRTPTEAFEEIIETMRRESGARLPLLTRMFAYYAIDLAMHDTEFSTVVSSRIAAAAVAFACKRTGVKFDNAMLLARANVLEPFLAFDEKHINQLYEGARLQETGSTGFNTQVLPKYSMIVKHYQSKFIQWFQGQLQPRFKRNVIGRRRHKLVLSKELSASAGSHSERGKMELEVAESSRDASCGK